MRSSIVLLFISCASLPSGCATRPFALPARCDGAEYHALDFWIGEWDVALPDGKRDGHNSITATLDHCAVVERWSDVEGHRGQSLFYFDRSRRRWQQTWVTDQGSWKKKEQQRESAGGSIIFAGTVPRPRGGSVADRTTLTPLPDGRVRQRIEQSSDGARHAWEGIYTRRPVAAPCAAPEWRQLDFWIGDWDLVVKARTSPTSDEWVEARATNQVTATQRGCAIEERFEAEGPGAPWAGHSVSMYVPADRGWRQSWIDDGGSWLGFRGGWRDGQMVLEGEPQTKDGVTSQMRMVFFDIHSDALRWRWERTVDGGQSWRQMLVIEYKRRGR